MIRLDIETHDRKLGFDIAGAATSLTAGIVIGIPGGAKIKYLGTLVRKSFGFPEVLQFIVDASINVELSLLAAWLYDKVKGRQVERIIINRRVVTDISKEGIHQVLEEEIRADE